MSEAERERGTNEPGRRTRSFRQSDPFDRAALPVWTQSCANPQSPFWSVNDDFDLLKERRARSCATIAAAWSRSIATRPAQPARSVSAPALLRIPGRALSHRGRASSGARPVGCAAYTWTSGRPVLGPELHRISCSTDMREREVVFGGEQRLEASLRRLIAQHAPRAAFVYGTCIVGVIATTCRGVQTGRG